MGETLASAVHRHARLRRRRGLCLQRRRVHAGGDRGIRLGPGAIHERLYRPFDRGFRAVVFRRTAGRPDRAAPDGARGHRAVGNRPVAVRACRRFGKSVVADRHRRRGAWLAAGRGGVDQGGGVELLGQPRSGAGHRALGVGRGDGAVAADRRPAHRRTWLAGELSDHGDRLGIADAAAGLAVFQGRGRRRSRREGSRARPAVAALSVAHVHIARHRRRPVFPADARRSAQSRGDLQGPGLQRGPGCGDCEPRWPVRHWRTAVHRAAARYPADPRGRRRDVPAADTDCAAAAFRRRLACRLAGGGGDSRVRFGRGRRCHRLCHFAGIRRRAVRLGLCRHGLDPVDQLEPGAGDRWPLFRPLG